jgi:hypothetical protein
LRLAIVVLLLALTGCAGLSLQARWEHAERLAARADWHKLRLPTDAFILSAYVPKHTVPSDTLTVYIEGDGLAWLTRSQAASDPTPRNPVALELALRHLQATAAYLARPCQYVEAADAKNCRPAFWTAGRFAPPVIEASSQAIDALKQRASATRLVLVGYSGGGAVAALVAARRRDVVRLVTVAGNLDHRAWTAMHGIPALADSLNPADEWRALRTLPQRHFVGGRDAIVGRRVTDAYLARFPSDQQPEVVTLPDFDHVCCWVEKWDSIWH